jgi:hypothetical protein
MAEGKALGKDDLFEKDVFQNATKGAQELLAIIKETQDTIKGSLTAQKEFVSTFKAKSYDDVKKLNTAIAETNTLIKQKEQLTKAEIQIQQQSEKLAQEKIKTQREEIKNSQLIEKQNKASERSLNALNGEYAKGVKQLAEIKKQLKELEYTGRNNGKLFKALSGEFDTLDKSVRGAEMRVGEFQRNVGNYKSGFNGLSNSINQISREMPAFAVSVNTGFLALSNNIPQLFDEITKLKKANIELAATGQPTTSAFKQVLGSVFSLQTLLSVGVTLLTIYGAKFFDLIGTLFTGEKAYKQTTESIEANTKAIEENLKAIARLQAELDKSVQGQLVLEKQMSDLDAKRADAMETYQNNLDEIATRRKEDSKDILKANAAEIKDETDRAKFLAKTTIAQGELWTEVQVDKMVRKREMSKEEISIVDHTNIQLMQKESEYRRAEKKAAELFQQTIDAANKEAYLKEVERQKKAHEKRVKDLQDIANDERQLQKILREIRLGYVADEKELAILRLQLKYDDDVKQINALKASEAHKAQVLKELERKLQRDLQEIRSSWNSVHIEEDSKLLDAKMKQNEAASKAFFAQQEKTRTEADKKQKDDYLKQLDFIEKALEKRYAIQNKLVNDNLDRETEANKTAIDTQQRLAEKGLENTLAFEKEKSAKLELEKKRQSEKEIKQQKIFAFYNLFSSYAKTDPNTALQKAIVDTALAEVISGSFIDGSENVERDLQGNKVHNGTDGYVVAVDGRERILNPDQNAKIGGISNDELANIAERYNKGLLFNYGNIAAQQPTIINQNIVLDETNTLLRQLLKETKNKPVHQPKIDMLGQVIDTEIRNGFSKVVTNKRRI